MACFHASGNCPVDNEQLNRSQKGDDRGLESYFKILLLRVSGPAALPVFNDLRQVSTSDGDKCMLSIVSLCLFSKLSSGSDAFVSLVVFVKRKNH